MYKQILISVLPVIMLSGGSAIAGSKQYDTSITDAAARIASEKLGDLRNTIAFDEDAIISEAVIQTPLQQDRVLRTPSPAPVTKPKRKLPRITKARELDQTTTGSIAPETRKPRRWMEWQKFDRYGNPLN